MQKNLPQLVTLFWGKSLGEKLFPSG